MEALPLRRCVSDVLWDIPTKKSWGTLSDPEIPAGGSWALEDLAICSQVRRTVWRKVRVCFSCLWGFIQWVTIPHLEKRFQSCKVLICKWYIRKCAIVGDVKQGCWIVRLKEGASLAKARTGEGAEFHWSDLTGFSQMTSNWADSH